MNPHRYNNHNNLHSSVPSSLKMKKSSGAITLVENPLVIRSLRVTLIDIFQTKSLSKDYQSNQQNGEKSDSDNSSSRILRRRPIASSVVIPESEESDAENTQRNDLTCARDCCSTKTKKHSRKAQSVTSRYNNFLSSTVKPDLYRSLSQDHRPRFMRSHKLKSPKNLTQSLTMSQPIDNAPSAHYIRSVERYRKMREPKNLQDNTIRTLFSSDKYLENRLQSPMDIDRTDNDEVIIDEGEPVSEAESERVTSSIGQVIDAPEPVDSVSSTVDKAIDDVKEVESIEDESDDVRELPRKGPVETILIGSSSSECSEKLLSFRIKASLDASIEESHVKRGFNESNKPKSPEPIKTERLGSGIIEVVHLDENGSDCEIDTDSHTESLSHYEMKKTASYELKRLSIDLSKDRKICDIHISKTRSTEIYEEELPRNIQSSKIEETQVNEKISRTEGKSEKTVRKIPRESEETIEKPYDSILPKINVLTVDEAEELGHAIRPETKARLKAEQKEEKLAAKMNAKKRGRKPGTKLKPKSKSKKDEDDTYRPGGQKRGRKKKNPSNTENNHNNNNEADVPCCIERGCCCTSGCLHGNNHKRPGRLPSLPEKPEYIFDEQQYAAALQQKNALLQAQLELDTASVTTDTSHLLGMSCIADTTMYHTASTSAPRPAAIIAFPPTEISGVPDLEGKTVTGFTVPLVPDTSTKRGSFSEDKVQNEPMSQDELESSPDSRENKVYNTRNHGKPKIIQEKLLPKGTIDLPMKLSQSPITPPPENRDLTNRKRTYEVMSSSETTGGTSSFGIKSTIPCKKSLIPARSSKPIDLESIASKLLSSFSKWSAIPEIAALLEPPAKKMRLDESPLDENAMNINEIKPIEKRKSLISCEINNSDLNNGRISNSSSLLKGLFSDPHIIPSSSKDRHRSERISKTSKKKNAEIPKNKRENTSEERKEKVMSLTRENLEALDKSCSSKAGNDVITDILMQMKPPGKSIIPTKAPDSTNRIRISSLNTKLERKNLIKDEKSIKISNEASTTTKTSLQNPEKKAIEKKKKARNGRWTLNDDENSSATSTETHPSAMLSYKSSRYSPIKFGSSATGKKAELIDSWLNKDSTLTNDHNDENSHSPHSAKTYMMTPPREEKTSTSIVSKPPTVPKDSDKIVKMISEECNEKIEGNDVDSASSHSSSSLTSTKSFSDTTSEAQSQEKKEDKQHSVDVNGNTRAEPEEKSKNKNEEDEEDDALFLDCQEDDLFFDERSISNEDMKATEKSALMKPPPVEKNDATLQKRRVTRKIVMATANEKPMNNQKKTMTTEIVKRIPSNTDSGHFSGELRNNERVLSNESGEALERASTASDLYQMGNVEKYESQTRREFNDAYYGYSAGNEADAHEPDEDYDPYAPVQQQAPSMHFPSAPEPYFKNLCWSTLKNGICNRIDCHYHITKYTVILQNLPKAPGPIIEKVLSHALEKQFFHMLTELYPEAIKSLELRPIQRICMRIRNEVVKFRTRDRISKNSPAWIFYQNSMKPTVLALTSKGYTPMTIINILSSSFILSDDEDRKKLMRALIDTKQVPPGENWSTFECLIKHIKTSLPAFVICPILDDCMRFEKSRDYLEDVFENVIRRTPEGLLGTFAENGLLRSFEQFLQPPPPQRLQQQLQQPLGNTTPMPEEPQEFNGGDDPASPEPESREINEISSIASPDSNKPVEINEKENKQRENIPEVKKKHVKERLGPRVIVRAPRKVEKNEPLELIPIDGVKKPSSIYRKYLWKLHIDLKSIKVNLKHREYERVIEILSRVKKELVQPFAQGFYLILCEEIMTSTDHLEAIIKCSVGGRRFNALPLLSEIGALLLIKLADKGVWILAYRLFKTLQRVFQLKKSSKYLLLISEIFIANHRPLQALSLLKQHKLISINFDKTSHNGHLLNDFLRISVLKNLLKSLCQNNPDEAFDVFKMILQEQTNNYSPFDLSKFIDDVSNSLIKFNKNDELIEMAQLIIHRNLTIQQLTLRTILLRIFHQDVVLSRQLYEYAIWIGIYPIIKIESPVYLRVNTDWVEEEMFLQISDLLTKMRKFFDSNDEDSPEEVSIYVNFEIVNSRGEFSLGYDTIGCEYNDILLENAKNLMKQVLKRFDPVIRVACDTERTFKLMSDDIIEFLTSEHVL